MMEKMYIFDILNAYFNNKSLEYTLDDEETKKLIDFCREQSLSPLLYLVFKKAAFKGDYVTSVINQERFITIQAEITKFFSQNKIPHMFFKGSVLYKLYPDSALRTRGDIDLIVPPNMYEYAKDVLVNNGYKLDETHHVEHHYELYRGSYLVELHCSFFDDENTYQEEFELSFDDYNENYEVTFNELDHFMYVISHFIKHIKTIGAGIRPLIDIGLMLKNKTFSDEELESELNKRNLVLFYDVLLNAINVIFDDIKPKKKMDVTKFLNFVIQSGIHGYSADNVDRDEIILSNQKKNKFSYILSKVFPPLKKFKRKYPICKSWWILIPFVWFYYVFKLVFTRLFRAKEILNSDKNRVNEINNFYKSIGL